jgi:hypothetical protein
MKLMEQIDHSNLNLTTVFYGNNEVEREFFMELTGIQDSLVKWNP